MTERVRSTLVIGRAGAESASESESESEESDESEEEAGITGIAFRIWIGGERSSSSVTVEESEEASTRVICCGGRPERNLSLPCTRTIF